MKPPWCLAKLKCELLGVLFFSFFKGRAELLILICDHVVHKNCRIKHCLNPEWVTTFEATFTFGKETKFNVSIFDEVKKTGHCKKIGSACFEMGEVLGSRGCVKAKKLKGSGTVFARVTKVPSEEYGTLHLQLRGGELKNVDGIFGKSDPYFVVHSQATEAGGHSWHPVYRSKPIMDDLNPEWQEASIPIAKVCGGDKDRSIQIEVWDWEKKGRHQPMGKFQTSVNGLISKCTTCTEAPHTPMMEGFKITHKGKSYGTVAVVTAHISGENLAGAQPSEAGTDTTSWTSRTAPGPREPLVRDQKDVQARFVPLCQKEGKSFRKNVNSYIRRARKGEQIVTEIDGVHESQKTVEDDSSWVVCGKAAGEHYVLTDTEFHESYDEDSEKPIAEDAPQTRRLRQHGFFEYKSKRFVWGRIVDEEDMRFFRHGANTPDFAYFVAPWGETMRVEKGDYLVTQHVPDGEGNGEVYRVERIVFEDSYAEEEVQPNQQPPTVRNQREVQTRFGLLLQREGRIFRKNVSSYVRRAKRGEQIVTAIHGVHESQKNVEDDSSWVVCGKAAGERYVLTDREFEESYDEESGEPIRADTPQSRRLRKQSFFEYKSKRFVWGHIVDDDDMRFFSFGADTPDFEYFIAPWGESMRVEKGDYLVTQYVPGSEGNGEVYRVERIVFEDSYADIDEEMNSHQHLSPATKPDFVDYISGGTEINLVAAIDFTCSNGDPRQPGTLHYIHRDGQLNGYEKALIAVGSIVGKYDSDQMFPVLGFGAKIGGVKQHWFQVGNAPELRGVQGMVEGYRSVFDSRLTMSGPTVFAEVIRCAAAQARKKQDAHSSVGKQSYTILLILTNGAVADIEQTKQAIRQASTAPLSIVIVGVGNADFSDMQFLDDFQRAEGGLTRDIVQFVEFSRHGHSREALTRETLDEIPDQLVGYFFGNGILPLPPTVASISDITEESCDDDVLDLVLEINEQGDIILADNAPGSSWDGQSYGITSNFLPQAVPPLAYVAPGQVPPATPVSSPFYQPAASQGASSYSYTPYSPGGSSRGPYVQPKQPSTQNMYHPASPNAYLGASRGPYVQPKQNSAQNMYQPASPGAYINSSHGARVPTSSLPVQGTGNAFCSDSSLNSAPYVSPRSSSAQFSGNVFCIDPSHMLSAPYLSSGPLPTQGPRNNSRVDSSSSYAPYASAQSLPGQDTRQTNRADSSHISAPYASASPSTAQTQGKTTHDDSPSDLS
jgi:hypothetical protein